MIRLLPYGAFTDQRGAIRDLLREQCDGATIISTAKHAVRGNHYHRETTQWTFLLKGTLRVVTQLLPGEPEVGCLGEGEAMLSPPMERHAWQALEDSEVLVLTRGPRSGENYEEDVVRLPPDERLIG